MNSQKDHLSFHRRLIRQGLATSWKHKHLWLFGFFAAFSGFGGAFEQLIKVQDRTVAMTPTGGDLLGSGFLPGLAVWKSLTLLSSESWVALSVYGLIGLVLLAVAAWVVVMALGATVSGVRALHGGKDLEFPEALREAGREFWRLFGVVAMIKVASLAAVVVIGISLINFRFGSGFLNGIFFFLSFAAFSAIAVIVSLLGMYAIMAVIDSRVTVREAVHRAWVTLTGNWLVSLEAGALILLTQLGIVLLLVGAVAVLMVPFVLLMLLALYFDLVTLGMIIAALSAVTVVLIMCLMAAFLTVFQVSVWWQLWLEFGRPNRLLAGLERWVGPFLGKFKVGKFKV